MKLKSFPVISAIAISIVLVLQVILDVVRLGSGLTQAVTAVGWGFALYFIPLAGLLLRPRPVDE